MTEPGPLKALGRELREARERKGWTVDQVAEKTRITARHLTEIEAGDVGRFPAAVYVRGFVRAYAKALELDEDTALKSLDDAGIAAAAAARPMPVRGITGQAPEAPDGANAKRRRTVRLAVGAVGAGVIAGGVLLVVSRLGDVRPDTAPPPSPFAAAPAAEEPAKPATAKPKAVQKPASKPQPAEKPGLAVPKLNGFPVVVAASARQDCVFQFQADGEERVRWWTLKAGEQTIFKAKKSLRLLITNPAGIEAAGPQGPLSLTRGARRPDHFMITAAGVERLPLPPEATPGP